mgnify:CR=1 FL=1
MAYKFNPFTGNLDQVGAGGGAATPGGADTQVQFNDGGALGGDAGLSYNKTTDKLTVGGDIDLGTVATFSTTLQTVTPTANRTVSIPDATGTIGLVNGPTGSIQFNQAGALNGTSDFSTSLVWNSATTTFTGLKLNVTDTASAADSKLLDLQVGGTSAVQVTDNKIQYSSSVVALYTGTGAGGSVDIAGIGSLDTVPLRVSYSFITVANRAKVGFTTGTNINSGVDVALSRDSAGVVKITDGSTGTGYLKLIPTTVGALTAAATVGAGTKAFVNDANATTFASVVAGGGSNVVPVYSDGTDWRIG